MRSRHTSRCVDNLPRLAATRPDRSARPVRSHEAELYQRQIDATDREIDRLVYNLYGLTEKEIGIVEGNG